MSSIISEILGPDDGRGGGRRIVAEVPVTVSGRSRKSKQRPPQQNIDDFWGKFTTKAPGKVTTIIPQNDYTDKAAKRSSARAESGGQTTQASYEEAATLCKAKVAKIVKECRRVNQKYRDPHFDLELDLKLDRRDCLESLNNWRDTDKTKGPDNRDKKDGAVKNMPADGDFDMSFNPQAVKRVVDIFDSPQFYIDGPTANDVRQGRDGDCWLMAALCTLSNKPGLIEKICVAYDQVVGVYGFVFHRDGEWFSEIIDDKLYLTKPDYDEGFLERILWEDRERVNSEEAYRKIYQSNSGALYFAQCENPNETWLPLLEKAYAKAHGDYAAIEGGFTGEGIEDLTGGVTSEIYTTDILDKEYFWKEELLKVNETFLFGCSTGVWGRGWGERKGIVELHAYSVMRAVEVDGVRLVLLKNPWGKHEWKGPWSDGSKEWTPEWLQKLNHRFGDDGSFWISYQDLLRKYQAFDRTRLFGDEWKVTSIWTTMTVPWTLEYNDTKFAFKLEKGGPVVLVLSQLDERYFEGLEGQYRFELSFRLHMAGEDDYLVRSQTAYRMNRSINVELDLEPGEYTIVVKIDAQRNPDIMSVEEVIRANAKQRREKLIRIGLAYDLAHSKGKIIETPEEKVAREAAEKQKTDKQKRETKKKIMEDRKKVHYLDTKDLIKRRKRAEKMKAKKAAKEEKRKAKAEENAKSGARTPEVAEKDPKQEVGEEDTNKDNDKKEKTADDTKAEGVDEVKNTADVGDGGDSTTEQGENTPSTSASDKSISDKVVRVESEKKESKSDGTQTEPEKGSEKESEKQPEKESTSESKDDTVEKTIETKGQKDDKTLTELEQNDPEPKQNGTKEVKGSPAPVTNSGADPKPTPDSNEASTKEAEESKPPEQPSKEAEKQATDDSKPPKEALKSPPKTKHVDQGIQVSGSDSEGPYPRMPSNFFQVPGSRRPPHHHHSHHHQAQQRHHPPPMGGRFPGRPPPPPPPDSSIFTEDESDSDLSSISSISEISDRELDIELEATRRRTAAYPPAPSMPPPPMEPPGREDEFEKDPWNAVAVIGLRVYYKVADEDKGKEIVKLRVERPSPYAESEGEEEEGKDKEEHTEKVLDVDDSAKDATLAGAELTGGDGGDNGGVKGVKVEEEKPEEEKLEEEKPEENSEAKKTEETKVNEKILEVLKPPQTSTDDATLEKSGAEEKKPEEKKSEETKPEESKSVDTKLDDPKAVELKEQKKPEETTPEESKAEETRSEEINEKGPVLNTNDDTKAESLEAKPKDSGEKTI